MNPASGLLQVENIIKVRETDFGEKRPKRRLPGCKLLLVASHREAWHNRIMIQEEYRREPGSRRISSLLRCDSGASIRLIIGVLKR